MTISPELFMAILSMESENRGQAVDFYAVACQ